MNAGFRTLAEGGCEPAGDGRGALKLRSMRGSTEDRPSDRVEARQESWTAIDFHVGRFFSTVFLVHDVSTISVGGNRLGGHRKENFVL